MLEGSRNSVINTLAISHRKQLKGLPFLPIYLLLKLEIKGKFIVSSVELFAMQ